MDTYEHMYPRKVPARRYLGWLKALVIALLLVFGLTLAWHANAQEHRYEYDAELLRIVDGDTYVMRLHIYPDASLKQHVRLADWDTPERRGKCAHETALALQAAIAAGLWFERAGGTVRAYITKVDSFGRPMARLVSPEGSLADALAAAGLARPFKRGRNEGWCDA